MAQQGGNPPATQESQEVQVQSLGHPNADPGHIARRLGNIHGGEHGAESRPHGAADAHII